jgi:hypothetical protein
MSLSIVLTDSVIDVLSQINLKRHVFYHVTQQLFAFIRAMDNKRVIYDG